jgi:clan AA aspartic protease
MIRGTVNSRREAIVRLRLRGPSGAEAEIDAIVDTGYTGALMLTSATVIALGLQWLSGGKATLADGSPARFDSYAADLEWDGRLRPVVVSDGGHEALLGMRLMEGLELRVQAWAGGEVEIGDAA